MLGNYLQQTTSADNICRCIFFLGALRVNLESIHNSENVCHGIVCLDNLLVISVFSAAHVSQQ